MPKFLITGKTVADVFTYVNAETEDEAIEIAEKNQSVECGDIDSDAKDGLFHVNEFGDDVYDLEVEEI